MFHYSVACGLATIGTLLMVIIVMKMMVVSGFAGFAANFYFSNQVVTLLVIMAYALSCLGYGVTTAITLGYQQVDWFILLATIGVAFIVWLLVGSISISIEHAVAERIERRRHRRYRATIAKRLSERDS